VDAQGSANDVDNGIHRANFVEVNGFQRFAVNLCLGSGDAMEDAQREAFNLGIQLAVLNEVANIGVGIMGMRVRVTVMMPVLAGFFRVFMVMMAIVMFVIAMGMFVSMVMTMVFVRMVVGMSRLRMSVGMPIPMMVVSFLVRMRMPVRSHQAGVFGFVTVFIGEDNVAPGSGDALLFGWSHFHMPAVESQFLQFTFQPSGVNAEVYERAQRHVTADARKAV